MSKDNAMITSRPIYESWGSMPGATFSVAWCGDTCVLIVDADRGPSVTNDAHAVIATLNKRLPGGIGRRRVYYRDSAGRFDELCVHDGWFDGFAACTDAQQAYFARLVDDSGLPCHRSGE